MFHAYGYDKGSTLKRIEAWLRIKERSGKEKQELQDFRPLKPEAAYLWALYCDIKRGCEFVRYADINSYCDLMKVDLRAWEVSLMLDIEAERCANG